MLTVDRLADFGADTQDGVSRCMGNEDFYLMLVKMVPQDENFQRLYQAVEEDDLDHAFEAAHALKGVLGNLSLTPLSRPVEEMTELLRARTKMDYTSYVETIRRGHEKLTELCEG